MNGIKTGDVSIDHELIGMATEFLQNYYREAVAVAARDKEDSVEISYSDLYKFNPDFADDLITKPRQVILALREGIRDVEIPVADSPTILKEVDVRISGVTTKEPIVSELRDGNHRGKYVGLRGQVSLATQVKPKLMDAMFRCKTCSDGRDGGFTIGPKPQVGDGLNTPRSCPGCDRNGPYELVSSESRYLDHQIIELTDPPGENPGETGNVVPVHLYGELAGTVKPGDRVRVNGIAETPEVQINATNQKVDRRQDWHLIGHAIDEEETAFEEVEPERVDEIQEIADSDNLKEQFIRSFAPGILTGNRGDKHKLAVVLSLFGGNSAGGRDDINVFFIGAPGTGKSHYLKRAKELAPKAVEASGKGATAAGLTATATKSDTTGKWMLDAGALVLASGGLACIDEFDKMADSVRQSMHEAMENQQVPINKAGINTTLTTETTVIAAANPKNGSFDRYQALNEQVEIGSPLLSRFDLIFGVSDRVDENRDKQIAYHQHGRVDSESEGSLEDELITEYIAYARQNINPSYKSEEPKKHLVDYYTDKRQESDDEDDQVTPVTPRMNDALRRLAQASARMHLREEITLEDAEIATELMDMTLGDTALEPDGTLNGSKMEGRNRTQAERVQAIKECIRGVQKTPAQISEQTGIGEEKVQHRLEKLKQKKKTDVMEPDVGEYKVV